MRIKNILVVGGGSSGWMAASGLAKYFGDKVKVSVVESSKISTVGVGESTIILFNKFLELVGLEDTDWMRHCNASYKTSIRFTDFSEKGTVFEYPFGEHTNDKSITEWAMIAAKYGLDNDSFCKFHNDNYYLATHNRLTKNLDGELNFNFNRDVAYHIDASAFGKFLKKKICDPLGVEHFVDDIVSVEKDEDGYLTSVVGDSGTKYTADLFVDCTGFRSAILEKEMHSEFLSYKDWLSNDRAISTRIPYTNKQKQLTSVTNCTALSSGWSWNIPLWNRIGTGYVYSSDFIDDDSAEKEFKKHLGTDDIEINKIRIRHGVRKNGWVKNVVGVGLSYGFIEPLESTGLVSTHMMISMIVELLDRTNLRVSGLDIDGYNYAAQTQLNGYRDFVGFHYKMSKRDDTPYWKYQTQQKNWWSMDESKFYRTTTRMNGTTYTHFYDQLLQNHSWLHQWPADASGILYILAGMGHRPFGNYYRGWLTKNNSELEDQTDQIYKEYQRYVKETEEHVKTLPTTFEFLKKYIYS